MSTIFAELRFRLPVAAMHAAGMYGHGFVNGGNAALLTGTTRPLKDTMVKFAKVHQTWRWSVVSVSQLLYPEDRCCITFAVCLCQDGWTSTLGIQTVVAIPAMFLACPCTPQ